MMLHIGVGVYLREVFVTRRTMTPLLYYQCHCYYLIKYETYKWYQ